FRASARERLPEELVPDVSEERGVQAEQGPEVRFLPEHRQGPVATPQGAVFQRELLAARPVPQRLPQEIEHGGPGAVVDDNASADRARLASRDGADVQSSS